MCLPRAVTIPARLSGVTTYHPPEGALGLPGNGESRWCSEERGNGLQTSCCS